jgi:hypothetical protein
MRNIPRVASLEALSGGLNEVANGRPNNVGTLTLTPSATSTVVFRQGVQAGDMVDLIPMTANANTAKATTWAIGSDRNEITVTHTSTASVDRTFGFVFYGVRQ